jgi:glycerol kinase
MPELLLGLDLGTSRISALAVDLAGRVRGRAQLPLETTYPAPGWVEQDPEQMVARSAEALRAALAAAGAGAGDVAGLGLAAQRATAVAWDARTGRALAPAIGWQDQRTAARAAELRRAGVPATPLASATKFEWWLRGEGTAGEAVRAAAKAGALRLGTPDAWLGARLGGEARAVTDPGHASCTGLYDLARGAWDPRALACYGVAEASLPALVATAGVAGRTGARLLGAPVPLAARAGDQQAAAFAQGVHQRGAAKLTLGTSAMLDVHGGSAGGAPPEAPGAHALALWRLAPGEPDSLCLEGTAITAGAALAWLARLGLVPEAEALDGAAAASSGGVWFVPALQGLGTPHMDFAARGVLGGLSLATGPGEIARAALEGIAQRCADLCEALGFAAGALPVDGGLARSDLLLQLLADATGAEVLRPREVETTALGAALLAGLGVGALPDLAACRALAPPAARIQPRTDAAARVRERAAWRARLAAARESAAR